MSSGGHRGFTVVTIITLIFVPFFTRHHWEWKLIGKTNETHVQACAPKEPCPQHRTIVNIVKQDPPAGTPQGGNDAGNGNNGGGNHDGNGNNGNGDGKQPKRH